MTGMQSRREGLEFRKCREFCWAGLHYRHLSTSSRRSTCEWLYSYTGCICSSMVTIGFPIIHYFACHRMLRTCLYRLQWSWDLKSVPIREVSSVQRVYCQASMELRCASICMYICILEKRPYYTPENLDLKIRQLYLC